MKKTSILIGSLILLILISFLPQNTITIENKTINDDDLQKVYRCCQGKCYLLKSYTEQDIIIKEINRSDINYLNDPIIFNKSSCSN